MNHSLTRVLLAGAGLIGTAGAQGMTIVLPTDGSTVMSPVLAADQCYAVTARGTFFIGGPGGGLADAEYADFSNPPASLLDSCSSGLDLGISIDGAAPNWGAYQPSHVYRQTVVGRNRPVRFRYADCFYRDNRGSLTITITQLSAPLVRTLPACTGNVQFTITPAQVGCPWTLDLSGSPGAAFLVMASTSSRAVQLAPFGVETCVGFPAFADLSSGLLSNSGQARRTFTLPVSLLGQTWYFQAVTVGLPLALDVSSTYEVRF